ncbi:hypothetical protein CYLTODRAFT_362224 [Cylindrobasidium torrendii FP15055 ss-10]|uniref:F-box domain-containing protein n=1 Tax=Cylindrobasidium torrendii FP15055 ss-10 TaxID=1314674 RepID=A0A0D7AVM2_9AGAR|nr:hypothetical protein CYLTODRAFT_362224 [Cylindrobasidium torrendii FP15055 ss-10]
MVTTDLPPEIWILVLRFATLSNFNPVDTAHTVSFLDPPHSFQLRLAAYRTSMRQKRCLALVCRQWRSWTSEFIYEYVWISKSQHAAKLARTLSTSSLHGCWIRRVHVESQSPFDKCNPADLRTILDHAPCLEIYNDHRSIRLSLMSINKPSARDDEEKKCKPDDLFNFLPNKLRKLSWTTYECMPSFAVLEHLTFLELHFHVPVDAMNVRPALPNQPLSLPRLQSLQTSLNAKDFSLLASWNLPALRNLSLQSTDINCSSPSFTDFFVAHGNNIIQLELGHSSSSILDQHYITPVAGGTARPIDLAALLPNLLEFICSPNAEWNWENPDWLAPHELLPAHPTVRLIGIRGIVFGDEGDGHSQFVLPEQMRGLLRPEAFPSLRYVRDMGRGLYESARRHQRKSSIESAGTASRRNVIGRDSIQEKDIRMADAETIRFWKMVWKGCHARGVYLEDWEGVNVTANDWRRLGFEV